MLPNFFLLDLRSSLWAFALFGLFAFVPGYAVGWTADFIGFRHRTAVTRLVLSVPVSIGVSPLLAYLTSRFGSIALTWFAFGVLWLVFLAVLAVLSLRSSARQHMLRRFIALVFLSFLTVAILLSGAFLGFLASTGVPMTGGSGARVFQPSNVGQVQRTYRTEFGTMTVDLRQVHFSPATTSVTASVAVGILTVDVPADAIVYLKTHVGAGRVQYIGNPNPYGYTTQPFKSIPSSLKTLASQERAPHLDLNVEVGVGQIDIQRGNG